MEYAALAVAALGVLIAGVGLGGVFAPRQLIGWVRAVWSKERLWFAVLFRLVIGALLIYAAPACRAPEIVRVLGVITILAAGALVFLGADRMQRFIEWWCERPSGLIRVWSAVGVVLGGFLIYAGI